MPPNARFTDAAQLRWIYRTTSVAPRPAQPLVRRRCMRTADWIRTNESLPER
jgi:hypothetical protein